MSSSITCARIGGKLIDMQACSKCFYKRLPDDISTVWCKFGIRQEQKRIRRWRIDALKTEIEEKKKEQEMLFTIGKPDRAEALGWEIKKLVQERRIKILINEAIAHITDEAMELNMDITTKIEEHLTAKCTNNTVAEKLLNKEKSLKELYDTIYEKVKEKAKEGKHRMVHISDEEVYRMAEEYYDLTSEPEQKTEKKEKKVDVLDFF